MDISTTNLTSPTSATAAVTGSGSTSSKAATAQSSAIAATAKKPVERSELEKAVKDIQKAADDTQRNLKFSIDDKTHKVVVKVIATETGLVVRQIPDEAALKLAQSLDETGSLIFDEKA